MKKQLNKNMKKLFIILCLALIQQASFGQYTFSDTKVNPCTEVEDQEKTGTCWSFATISFLESELLRMGKPKYDLSEMYGVRAIYLDKAENYLFRQGKANFSQGSLSHDVIRAYKMVGVVPETAYPGYGKGRSSHSHGALEKELKMYLDGLIKTRTIPENWRDKVNEILDTHLGELPDSFNYDGRSYTPESFSAGLGINPDDYVTLTSFTHHPFYSKFILEIPDNYSNGFYYNVMLDELVSVTNNAINNGFTVAWDADVSEPFFLHGEGFAIVPKKKEQMDEEFKEDLYQKKFYEEKIIDQDFRQSAFESYSTTDDHLMHIVGFGTNDKGEVFYKTKNSWGTNSNYAGFVYVSPSYFKLKTIAVMVHKDAIPGDVKAKLGL
jgi:bleomycin hydrolase